jgi:hypothetical protein
MTTAAAVAALRTAMATAKVTGTAKEMLEALAATTTTTTTYHSIILVRSSSSGQGPDRTYGTGLVHFEYLLGVFLSIYYFLIEPALPTICNHYIHCMYSIFFCSVLIELHTLEYIIVSDLARCRC